MRVGPRPLLTLLIVILVASLNGCGSSSDTQTGVRFGDSSAWYVKSADEPRTLTVGTEVGYCVGEPKPRIGSPKIEYRGDDVFITLRTEKPSTPPAEPNELCAGVDLFVARNITLKRDLDDVEVFDAGVDPPLQRWPD